MSNTSPAGKPGGNHPLPAPAEPWRAVFAQVMALSPEDKTNLGRAIENTPGALGSFVVVPARVWEFFCTKLPPRWLGMVNDLAAALVGIGNEAYRGRRCSRLKEERVRLRNAAIDQARAAGIGDEDGLRQYLLEHHPDLAQTRDGRPVRMKNVLRAWRASKRGV
jgi:hypothetical protein